MYKGKFDIIRHAGRLLLIALVLLGAMMNHDNASCNETTPPQTTVEWYRASFPPVTIPDGVSRNSGFFDKVMFFLIERLPDYKHTHHTANFKRIIGEIQSRPNSCCPSLYKTPEREKFISFSEPALVVLPNGVITTPANTAKLAQYVADDGTISLAGLLADETLTLGISNGRIYSGGIDDIIAGYRDQPNILVQSGNDVFKSLLGMLNLGRVDYIIGYPTEASYFSSGNPPSRDFLYYPITESGVSYTIGYIGCPKNEWGNRLITKIDKLLLQYRQKEFFLEFYSSWLDTGTQKRYRKIANSYFNSLQQQDK